MISPETAACGADRFFPGTSVLHTRLRYALFVPWLVHKVCREGTQDLGRRLQKAETDVAKAQAELAEAEARYRAAQKLKGKR